MDPLSQVFSMLNIRGARCTRFEASGEWSYRFPAKPALKFGAVMSGKCWITFADGKRHHLSQGDCFLLANAPEYVLANDEGRLPLDGIAAFDWNNSDIAHHAGDDDVLIAGAFTFEETEADFLLGSLPRFISISGESASADIVRSILQTLNIELKATDIGASVLIDRLVDVLLVHVLRAAMAHRSGENFGWIGALCDHRIGKAIRLMHEDSAHPWTLDLLAASVAMSRSSFAKHFRSLVGASPLDYLLRWRMRVARDLLHKGATVAYAATTVGYSSESAFGHAFKRVYGEPPKKNWHRVRTR